jgi:subfamily B ATP-binding cassette protein MsbA
VRQGLETYGRILTYVRPYWYLLLLAAISLVIFSLLTLAVPWVIKNLLDTAAVAEDVSQLNRYALVLGVIFVLRAGFGFVQTYLLAWVGEQVVAALRRETFDHLLSLSLGFFAGQRVGELVSRLSNDVQVIRSAVTSDLIMLLQQVVTAAGVVVIVSLIDWRLTALTAVAIPGIVLVTRLLGRRMRRASRQVQDTLADASAVVEETIGGIRIVQSFAREAYESQRFGQRVNAILETAMHRTKIYATLGPLVSLFSYGGLALVMWFGARQVLQGQMTLGDLVAFLLYAVMLMGPMSSFASLYGKVQEALGSTERIFELIDTRPEVVELADAPPLRPVSGHITFNDVSFEYDPRQPVLRHVTLEARPGEVIALVGPSGSGKTTLVNLIPRFYDPSSGHITIDGHDARHVTLHSLRDQIGIVPQETLLFSDTIASNIRYGKLDATQDELEAAARAANAHYFIVNELPDGYRTHVGERGIKLSGGQRQRIAIARAILKDPHILILDEATSSLDTESEQLVQEALDRLMRPTGGGLRINDDRSDQVPPGRTTFVIAHRLSTITNADRIVVLRGGQVAEVGTHEELLAQEDSLYRHYYALQFQWDSDSLQLNLEEMPVTSRSAGRDWVDDGASLISPPDIPATWGGPHQEPEDRI